MAQRGRLSWSLVTGVVVVGLLGSWALSATMDQREQAQASTAMDQRAQVVESAVVAEIRRYVDTSADLAAALGAQGDLDAGSLTALTRNLSRARLPGATGTSVVVPAADSQVAEVQREWRGRGNPDLVLVPVGTGDDHLFVVLNHPLDGSVADTGRDVSQAPEPTQALGESRERSRVTASATYVLLTDRDLPSREQQQSFLLAAPIVGAAGTAQAGAFEGWLVMGVRGRDFIVETLQQASQDTVAVTLLDDSTTATGVPVAGVGVDDAIDGTELERSIAIPVAGRTWRLLVQPTDEFRSSLGPSRSTRARNAGVLFTLLIALLVGTLSTSRQRALAKVDSATAALRADIERRELVEAALREREEELRVMALTDSLTGVDNRWAFMAKLDQGLARSRRQRSHMSVLFCDIDDFKTINDSFGHAAGDAVLREVATRLREQFRIQDTVGRLGGDEFAIICEDGSDLTEALLDRLRDILAVPYTIADQLITAGVSVGIASPRDDETAAQLLERADSTMYAAKAARRVT